MVLKPDQERVKAVLSDTVTLLCRNGLTYNKKFSISALIGITVDDDDVFLVEIRETVVNASVDAETDTNYSESLQSKSSSRKPKRKRKHLQQSSVDSNNENGIKSEPQNNNVGSSIANLAGLHNIKREQTVEHDSDEDLIFIKDEPRVSGGDKSNLPKKWYPSQQPPSGDILENSGQQGQLYTTPAPSKNITDLLTSWTDSTLQDEPGVSGGDMSYLYSQQTDSKQMYSSQHPPTGDNPWNIGQQGQLYNTPAASENTTVLSTSSADSMSKDATRAPTENRAGPSTSMFQQISSTSQQFSGGAGLPQGKELSQQSAGSSMQGTSSQVPEVEGKRYGCEHCDLTFTEMKNVHSHIKSKHLGIFRFPCPECPRGLYNKVDLHGHLACVHGHQEYLHHCPHCPKFYTLKRILNSHIKNCHQGDHHLS